MGERACILEGRRNVTGECHLLEWLVGSWESVRILPGLGKNMPLIGFCIGGGGQIPPGCHHGLGTF